MASNSRQLAREAIVRHYAPYDDPVAAEIGRRQHASPEVTTTPATGILSDVQGSPRESIDLSHLGKVLAERERLRRSAE